jgi:phosphate/sulfate permease
MKNPQESVIIAIGLYLVAMVVVLTLTTILRCTYWRFTQGPVSAKQAFVYGIVFARTLGILACGSGLIGAMVCYNYALPVHYSLLATPFLPLIYSFMTTKQTRWRTYMGDQ